MDSLLDLLIKGFILDQFPQSPFTLFNLLGDILQCFNGLFYGLRCFFSGFYGLFRLFCPQYISQWVCNILDVILDGAHFGYKLFHVNWRFPLLDYTILLQLWIPWRSRRNFN